MIMSGRKRCVICTVAVAGMTLTLGSAAMAQESSIAFPYEQETAWDEIAITNDDTVSTGVNVRSSADENSPIIGCLYQGGAAWVIDRGDEWTEISSGGLTGFVKNEYLVYGEDAQGLAQSYGVEGVATTWNDVKLYSGADGGSQVLDSLTYGDSFILTQDEGHWLQVQNGADSTAYVSSEDVSRVLLLDTAVAADEAYLDADAAVGTDSDGSGEEAYADETYTDTSYEDTSNTDLADVSYGDTSNMDLTDVSYEDTSYTDTAYTDTTYTDETYTNETYTDTSSIEESYTDTPYTEETYTDGTSADAGASGVTQGTGTESYYDAATGIYYDASSGLYYDSGTGILYDAWWNPVNEAIATPMTTGSTGTSDGSSGDGTEDYADSGTADSSDGGAVDASQTVPEGTDDTSLLAALIYCEAGNQDYDGMVAVGAVVMNRVNSPSFPNSISEVIYQSGQFTPASSGGLASALANGVPSACYDAAAAAIGGENPVGDSLYFNTGSGKGTKLGDHQFY